MPLTDGNNNADLKNDAAVILMLAACIAAGAGTQLMISGDTSPGTTALTVIAYLATIFLASKVRSYHQNTASFFNPNDTAKSEVVAKPGVAVGPTTPHS